MKRKITVLFCCLVYHTGFAGNTDSLKTKNEVGLNLNFISIIVLGGSAYSSEMAMTYRHFFDARSALRIRPSVEFRNEGYELITAYNSQVIAMDDSTKTMKITRNNMKPIYQLNAGYEWHWGEKKLTWFTGGDLAVGYLSEEKSQNEEIWTRYPNGVDVSPAYWPDSVVSTHSWNTKQKYAGISPLIGCRLNWGKHWGFSFQTGFMVSLGKVKQEEKLNGIYQSESEWWQLDFNTKSMISDFSLLFRF